MARCRAQYVIPSSMTERDLKAMAHWEYGQRMFDDEKNLPFPRTPQAFACSTGEVVSQAIRGWFPSWTPITDARAHEKEGQGWNCRQEGKKNVLVEGPGVFDDGS